MLSDVKWAQVLVLAFTLLLAVLPHPAHGMGFHQSIPFQPSVLGA